jgi:hypothetical protein
VEAGGDKLNPSSTAHKKHLCCSSETHRPPQRRRWLCATILPKARECRKRESTRRLTLWGRLFSQHKKCTKVRCQQGSHRRSSRPARQKNQNRLCRLPSPPLLVLWRRSFCLCLFRHCQRRILGLSRLGVLLVRRCLGCASLLGRRCL